MWLCFYRFTRHYINLYAFWKLKPIPIPDNPSYTSKDVTAIIPTINGDGHDLRQTIRTVLLNDPSEIVISTIDASHERAKKMVAAIGCKKIKIVTVPQANKRRQLCRAIPEVTTRITLLVDDDVIWPETLLPWILAPFENSKVGGVGTCQRLLREETTNMWNFLGAIYLERRNFDCGSCTFMDGGLPCLSGRTVAYRTHILQDSEFTYGFTHETWRGCLLNADDDNFITRWMVNKGWNTYIQYHRECEVLTTLESGSRYLRQCQRWARSNWRSNLRSMLLEGNIWM
ncbi:hypothetical protein H2201_001461 [Coniosporium apollinis]|uniref:Glycosyltransferase 2-like domain-containing protein n=1 Tax=Coniosporium apollinis TaxID=61459 RepID=A0ABQ9P2D2_9PEZI|nr:hypothetical protein H2201_001461 [Coniosporium apollinis]